MPDGSSKMRHDYETTCSVSQDFMNRWHGGRNPIVVGNLEIGGRWNIPIHAKHNLLILELKITNEALMSRRGRDLLSLKIDDLFQHAHNLSRIRPLIIIPNHQFKAIAAQMHGRRSIHD